MSTHPQIMVHVYFSVKSLLIYNCRDNRYR